MPFVQKGIAGAAAVAVLGVFVATVVPQPVRAGDKDDHKGDVDRVKVVNGPTEPVPVTGQVSVTLPPVQTVQGTVNVGNFPASQAISGTVSVGNLPTVQTIQGNVVAPLAPFGVYNNSVVFPGPTPGFQFVVSPNHDAQIWVSVSVTAPTGQAVMGEIANFSTNPVQFFQIPTQFFRADVTCGCDIRLGTSAFPIYVPANSNLTLAILRDLTAAGFLQGSMTFTGVLLN